VSVFYLTTIGYRCLTQSTQWTANTRDRVLVPSDKRQLTNKIRTLFLVVSNCHTVDNHSDILPGHRSCGVWVCVWRFGHNFCHHRHVALHCCSPSNAQVLVSDRSSRHKHFLLKFYFTGARFWIFTVVTGEDSSDVGSRPICLCQYDQKKTPHVSSPVSYISKILDQITVCSVFDKHLFP